MFWTAGMRPRAKGIDDADAHPRSGESDATRRFSEQRPPTHSVISSEAQAGPPRNVSMLSAPHALQ